MEQVVQNGVNRARTWQIGLFALNNTATNCYYILMTLISYYTFGPAGLLAAIILNILTAMRIFDGITDPIIGNLMDKTMTKFGKYRPFILAGQIIMATAVILMFTQVYKIENQILAYVALIAFYAIYVIGYTCQTAVTKAAQTALTSDPKQRPVFTLFDSIYTVILNTFFGMQIIDMITKHETQAAASFFNDMMWFYIPLSFILSMLAMLGIWDKDNELYIIENKNKVKIKDLIPIIRKNRAIQMLIVAASTDKLATTISGNSMIIVSLLFYTILGNGDLSKQLALPISLCSVAAIFIGVFVAQRVGLKKALVTFSIIAIIGVGVFMGTIIAINPEGVTIQATSMAGILFIGTYIFSRIGMSVSSGIVIPMIADCSDYETYRSGKVVPGSMGTLFSFVDKLVSSFGTSVISLLMIVFAVSEINNKTAYSTGAFWIFIIGYCVVPILGWVASLIAMKFYPLNKAKMKEVQDKLAILREESAENYLEEQQTN